MKLKKRKKPSRMRGSRNHGYAAKKHKGKGNKGGKGMAGSGKRAGHKLTFLSKYLNPYLGKQGYTSRSTERDTRSSINLRDISDNLNKYKNKAGEIELKDYKILGEGEIKEKLTIRALSFSKQAKEKIEKAGGRVISLKEEKIKENKDKIEEKKKIKAEKNQVKYIQVEKIEKPEEKKEKIEESKKIKAEKKKEKKEIKN